MNRVRPVVSSDLGHLSRIYVAKICLKPFGFLVLTNYQSLSTADLLEQVHSVVQTILPLPKPVMKIYNKEYDTLVKFVRTKFSPAWSTPHGRNLDLVEI